MLTVQVTGFHILLEAFKEVLQIDSCSTETSNQVSKANYEVSPFYKTMKFSIISNWVAAPM